MGHLKIPMSSFPALTSRVARNSLPAHGRTWLGTRLAQITFKLPLNSLSSAMFQGNSSYFKAPARGRRQRRPRPRGTSGSPAAPRATSAAPSSSAPLCPGPRSDPAAPQGARPRRPPPPRAPAARGRRPRSRSGRQ